MKTSKISARKILPAFLSAFLCWSTTAASAQDSGALAAANNAFAFKLLKQLAVAQPAKNIFISPYSAATALQMAANGAAGQTKMEMQQVLETSGISPAVLNEASKVAAASLNSTDTNLVLTTANALWYRQGAQIKPGFLEANAKFFSSTIKPLDFGNVPAAEAEINQWASDQTRGRITGIANGMIDPLYTDLVLANAIYFKGRWLDPFDVKLTKERPFYDATKAKKNLPMMEISERFAYRKGSGYQAVQLPYLVTDPTFAGDLAMFVFLPDPGSSPEKLLGIMNGDTWHSVTIPGFDYREGMLVLPKFKLQYSVELNQALKMLGMKTAFDITKADFSRMFSDQHHISEVRQKAFVAVDEKGTEAAAVTVFEVNAAGIEENPPKPFKMIVDRPFMFAIVETHSQMILFIGIIYDPAN